MPAAALREAFLSRLLGAPDGEALRLEEAVAAEDAALAAARDPLPWAEVLAMDPDSGPPDGGDAWLRWLPGPVLEEYGRAEAGLSGTASRELLKAGFWDRACEEGAGFASGGAADRLAPGPVLARLAADAWAGGLGALSDDEVVGVLRAARRMASWSAALEASAAGDLMRRRLAEEAAGEAGVAEHLTDEVAAALTLTGRSAGLLMDRAMSLGRLPATMRALAAGDIDLPRAQVIADEVVNLADAHAAIVELAVIRDASGETTGELRAATRRAVIAADPGAARARKEQAQREARVERWDEPSGAGALAGRDLPPTGVIEADHHLSTLALALREAGLGGTMDNLRARVFLALLAGRSPESLLPPPPAAAGGADPPGVPGRPGGPGVPGVPDGPGGRVGAGLGRAGVRGVVNLTMPLATWLGLSAAPGEAVGLGPLDAADSRALAAVIAQDPRSRWCLTITDTSGHPVGHGCAAPRSRLGALAGVEPEALEAGGCRHRRESPAYRPPPALRHLVSVRQATCSFPGCRRSAARCDQDHTLAWEQGGRTCQCNLAPLCRAHHRAKQTRGWRLVQPEPGVMVWVTPSGRAYATGPTVYPDG